MTSHTIETTTPSIRKRWSFTLIELLVCVAIIAILMALLLPALSRVRYRAKLLVCMNNQHQAAVSISAYASSNSGRYPSRQMFNSTAGGYTVSNYAAPNGLFFGVQGTYDERPMLQDVLDVNGLQCPFPFQYDFVNSTSGVSIRDSFSFYHSFKFDSNEKAMDRVTREMTFKGETFDLLIGDMNIVYNAYVGYTYAESSHPDYGTNRMSLLTQNSDTHARSKFRVDGTIQRGPIDLNFTRKDGSAFRISKVTVADTRLKKVFYKYQSGSVSTNTSWTLLPTIDFD